jgi:hypothetical protein
MYDRDRESYTNQAEWQRNALHSIQLRLWIGTDTALGNSQCA